jgi:hypothetical protein
MSGSVLDWFLNSLTPTPNETHVPSTAEIIQKCLTVNPFELKFREANRRLSQSQDGLDQNSLVAPSLTLPTSAGLSMLKLSSSLSQSPTIFSNINLLSADLDFTRKLRESGFMNTTKGEGNRTPCTADVLNAVLDMNMNHPHMAAAAAAAVGNSNNGISSIPFSSAQSIITSTSMPPASTSMSEPNFAFPSSSGSSSSIKMDTTPPAPPTIQIPSSLSMPMSQMSDISTQSASLTSLQPPVNITTSFSTGHLSEMDKSDRMLNIDTNWEQDIKPDISSLGPPIKRMATEPLSQNYCASEGSPFSNSSNVSRRSEEPVKTTRKYHSRCTDGSAPRSGRGRRSITTEMPADERRQTILERNKAAAVRYRKRKKEEHDEMITRVNLLEQDKGSIVTQNAVLRREVERLTELLKLRDARCVCHAAANLPGSNSQSLLASLPPEPNEQQQQQQQQHAFNLHMNRQ